MWAAGMFTKTMKKRVVFAGGLLAFQGLLGWYMVKSGLDHDNFQVLLFFSPWKPGNYNYCPLPGPQ